MDAPTTAQEARQKCSELPESGYRVYQGGNLISGQQLSGTGKTLQGNNIRSDSGDVNFNI
jgi:hypothetical protein